MFYEKRLSSQSDDTFFRNKKTGGDYCRPFFVRPWGVEPQSSEPESDILSIELRAHFSDLRWQKYKINVSFAKRFMQNL